MNPSDGLDTLQKRKIDASAPNRIRSMSSIRKHYSFIYSKTCLKRNAIVPVFFFRFHRFPFYKGLCFKVQKI
jgi:hypothetical protein